MLYLQLLTIYTITLAPASQCCIAGNALVSQDHRVHYYIKHWPMSANPLYLCTWLALALLISATSQASMELSDAEQRYLAEKSVIRKCVDPNWMPLEGISQAGEHIGVLADITDLIAEKIDTPIKLVPTESWLESMEKLENRECDIVTSDTKEGDEPEFLLKTTTVIEFRNVYITREDVPMSLNFSSITHLPIGIPEGYPTIELINEKYPNTLLIEVKNVDEGLLKVSQGELYAFTGILPVSSYSIKKQGLTNLKVAGHLDFGFGIVMDVRSDEPLLLDIFNKSLANIDPAIHTSMLSRWINVNYDIPMLDKRWLWGIAGLVILSALVLYWNRKLALLNRELDVANHELSRLNETDTLTGLKNRNFLSHTLPGIVADTHRQQQPLAIAILDLDRFKALNDHYGHAIGDKCLTSFAKMLRQAFRREKDWLVRYGGEEFLVICAGISQQELEQRFLTLQQQIHLTPLTVDRQTIHYTFSAGYVHHAIAPEKWEESFISAADAHLYAAKNAGRDQFQGSNVREST